MTRLPAGQLAFSMPETVQSVVRCPTNGPLLAAAAQLWIADEDLVVDVTYGRGNFWTHYRPAQLVAHDLALDRVDFRHLPEPDRSIDVVVFDPPYIPQGGRDTSTLPDFLDRYGLRDAPTSQRELEKPSRGLKRPHPYPYQRPIRGSPGHTAAEISAHPSTNSS